MFFKRPPQPPEPVLHAEPPPPDPSLRRQGGIEALNLIARSLADAAREAQAEARPGEADNFIAGQLMALGHITGCIERERDLLQQQLVHEAGLHSQPEGGPWDAEMALLGPLPASSEELFRLAMDYRKVEEPEAPAEEATEGSAAEHDMVAAKTSAGG